MPLVPYSWRPPVGLIHKDILPYTALPSSVAMVRLTNKVLVVNWSYNMKHKAHIRKFRKVLTAWERFILAALRKEHVLKVAHVTD